MSKTIKVSNGDLDVDARGRFSYIGEGVSGSSGREKCAQDLAAVLLQDLYADETWGSNLNLIEQGRVIDALNSHRARISMIVQDAVNRLMTLQDQDQDIPDTEKIKKFSVSVDRISGQQLSYVFLLSVETVSGDSVPLEPYVIELEQVSDPNLIQF